MPATKGGKRAITVLRAAKAELERAKQIENLDDRRAAVRTWALGLGYKDWLGPEDNKSYQQWRDGVMNKFATQIKGLEGLDDGGPPEYALPRPPPPPPLPSSAAGKNRTPPAAQPSRLSSASEQQPSAIRQRVLPPSVGEGRDEPIPQVRPLLNKP